MLRVETVNYGRSLIFFCNKTILLKRLAVPAEALAKAGVPGRIRTYDLRIRNPLLYPTELQAHIFVRLD